MTKKLKVMTVVGTRPEIIRLSRVISKLDVFTKQVLVHTGQNYDYGLNKIFFEDLEIRKPDYFLNAGKGRTASEAVGAIIEKSDAIIRKERPDAFLVLGDTNSCLAAYSAKRNRVPIFHMEAGNRCFSNEVPEEINRKVVDHLADINLPYSDIARSYLIREGIHPHSVIKTGSPMREVIEVQAEKVKQSPILKSLNLKKEKYFLVSLHRDENVENQERLETIFGQLCEIGRKYRLPLVFSTHPRTKKKLSNISPSQKKGMIFCPPFSFSDYLRLQIDSALVLSDSGTISEEASILGFNAINLRNTHERPEAMESAAVPLAGTNGDSIVKCADFALVQWGKGFRPDPVLDYSGSKVSDVVVRIIHSYFHLQAPSH